MKKPLVVVRGAGDIATGVIWRLWRSGFPVIATECARPSAIRRKVAFSEAVYDGKAEVEGAVCCLVRTTSEAEEILAAGMVPLFVDENCVLLRKFNPDVLVDAILAKKNLGTNCQMAPVTIALGPGFTAGKDVDAVVETKRGHHLGRVYLSGEAIANTSVPGEIGGVAEQRVIHAPVSGVIHNRRQIGDVVFAGECLAVIEMEDGQMEEVIATIPGVLRGLIRDGYAVDRGLKIADIDPRLDQRENCFTISDKARAVAGGVLEAILYLTKK